MRRALAGWLLVFASASHADWPDYWPLETNAASVVTNSTQQLFGDLINALDERCRATWLSQPVITNCVVSNSVTNCTVTADDIYEVNPLILTYSVPYSTGLAIESIVSASFLSYSNSVTYTNAYTYTNWIVSITNIPCTNFTCYLPSGETMNNYGIAYDDVFALIDDKIEELLPYYVETSAGADYAAWYAARFSGGQLVEYAYTNQNLPPRWMAKSNLFRVTGIGHQWSATSGASFAEWMALPGRLITTQLLCEFQIYATNTFTTNGVTYKGLTYRWADAQTVAIGMAPASAWSNNGPATVRYRIANPHTNNQSIAGATFSVTGMVRHWAKPEVNAPVSYETNGTFQFVGGSDGTAYNVNFYDITGGSSSFHMNEPTTSATKCEGASVQIWWVVPYSAYDSTVRRPTAEVFNERYTAINQLRYTAKQAVGVSTGNWGFSDAGAAYTDTVAHAQAAADSTYLTTNNVPTIMQMYARIDAAFDEGDTQMLYVAYLSDYEFRDMVEHISPRISNKTIRTFFTADTNILAQSIEYRNSEFAGGPLGVGGFSRGLNALSTIAANGTSTVWYGSLHGSTDKPLSWPADPPEFTNQSENAISVKGYEERFSAAIIDWGFEYKDW